MTDLFLGRIELAADGERHPHAHLQPIYQSYLSENNLVWKRIDNLEQRFPKRGLVTWFNAPLEAKKDSIWQFTVEESNYDPNNIHHNLFKTRTTPNLIEEIIDLRKLGNENEIRESVSTKGIHLSFVPSKRVYLWIENETWIGPIQLIAPQELEETWKVDTNQPLACVKPAPEDDIQRLNIGSNRLFLAPNAKTGCKIGQIDWAPIIIVLKRVLQRLRKIDLSYKNELQLTDQVISRITTILDSGGLDGINAYLETHRLNRANDIIKILKDRHELVDKLIEDILKLPTIDKEIESAKNEARVQEVRRIESELSEKVGLIEEKQKEILSLDEEKTKLLDDLSNLKMRFETKLETFESDLEVAFQERIEELQAQPEKLIVDSIIFRAIFAAHSARNYNTNTPHLSQKADYYPIAPNKLSYPPGTSTKTEETTLLTSFHEFQEIAQNKFNIKGLSRLISPLHSAFLSGAMPILYGCSAYEILEDYASLVAGGKMLWLPISPTMIDPSDLLGKFIPSMNRLVPQPGGLLDLLLLAKKTNDMYLVVLDGINRSSADTYLAPLIACYKSRFDSNKRALPLFPPNLVPNEDPYAEAAWVEWPPNVLLAGILSDGLTSIPPSASFWDTSILLAQTKDSSPNKDSNQLKTNISSPLCSISSQLWNSWVTELDESAAKPNLELKVLFKNCDSHNLNFFQNNLSFYSKFHHTLSNWSETNNKNEDLIICSLIPKAISLQQESLLTDWLKNESLFTKQVETGILLARQALS